MIVESVADLQESTAAYFAAQGVDAPVLFGWQAAVEQKHERSDGRVVFVPGDQSGKVATYNVSPATTLLGDAETLVTEGELFTVYVWARASDPNKDHDDKINYRAVKALYDWVYRALFDAAGGRVTFDGPAWVPNPLHVTNGKELMLGATLRRPILDRPVAVNVDPTTPGHVITANTHGTLNETVGCCDDCEEEPTP